MSVFEYIDMNEISLTIKETSFSNFNTTDGFTLAASDETSSVDGRVIWWFRGTSFGIRKVDIVFDYSSGIVDNDDAVYSFNGNSVAIVKNDYNGSFIYSRLNLEKFILVETESLSSLMDYIGDVSLYYSLCKLNA